MDNAWKLKVLEVFEMDEDILVDCELVEGYRRQVLDETRGHQNCYCRVLIGNAPRLQRFWQPVSQPMRKGADIKVRLITSALKVSEDDPDVFIVPQRIEFKAPTSNPQNYKTDTSRQ